MKLFDYTTIANIVFLLLVAMSSKVYAGENNGTPLKRKLPTSWIMGSVHENSIADRAQLEQILMVVMEGIRSKRNNEESIHIINQSLRQLDLPEIKSNATIEVVHGNGFSASIEGAVIIDSTNKFCLPCKVGWNMYEFGILNRDDPANCEADKISLQTLENSAKECNEFNGTFELKTCPNYKGELKNEKGVVRPLFKENGIWTFKSQAINFTEQTTDTETGLFDFGQSKLLVNLNQMTRDGKTVKSTDCTSKISF